MSLPSGNPFKCLEEVLSSQAMTPPKRFDIFPLCGMLRRYFIFSFFDTQRMILYRVNLTVYTCTTVPQNSTAVDCSITNILIHSR